MTTTWINNDGNLNFLGGGLEPGDRDYLQSLAQSVIRPGMIGFDIGCYTGWTGLQVAPIFTANGGKFYLADWFRGSFGTSVGPYEWGQYASPTVLLANLNNIEASGLRDDVSLLISTTDDLGKIVADGIADYVYIGADHRYSCIKRDIETWLPKLRSGGMLCGHAFSHDVEEGSDEWAAMDAEEEHDYYGHYRVNFGVVKAVHELLPGYQLGGTNLWSYRKA